MTAERVETTEERIRHAATELFYEHGFNATSMRDIASSVADAEEALRTFLRWHVEFHATNRLKCRDADIELRSLLPEARRAHVEVRDAHEELLIDLLRRGQAERGWVVTNERVVAIAILSLCTEVDAWFRDDGPLTAGQVADIYLNFIVSSLEGRST